MMVFIDLMKINIHDSTYDKMSWKGLIGVQILSYVLFINEIVVVRHMCCS